MVKKYFSKVVFVSIISTMCFSSCIINDNIKDTSVFVAPGNDPNFKIIVNLDTSFENFNRKVIVFDIPIYAFRNVDDAKLLHTANILAQYIDNNEDGNVDNVIMHAAMKAKKGFLFLWKTTAERDEFVVPNGFIGQDLGSDETNLTWHANGHAGVFDAALEEVWHIVTTSGYEKAYPTIFSSLATSEISIAMDVARGGTFQNPPNPYPTNAWYTYDDVTCNYECQVSEYSYWVLSSILGAQENRLTDIENEWKLNTALKVQTTDTKAWTLFNNPTYKLPTVLPDGTYKN